MKKLFGSLLVVLTGCGNADVSQFGDVVDSSVVLDVSEAFTANVVRYDEFLEEVKIVPLENSPASALSLVENLITTDEYIYVLDNQSGGGVAIF